MSIEANPNRNDYVGNGAVDTYDYSFKIFDKTDLLVETLSSTFVKTTLVLDTDYEVSGVGLSAGGDITLLGGNLPLNTSLTILGKMPIEQQNNIGAQGDFDPNVIEEGFDKSTILLQQLSEKVDRSLKIPSVISSDDFDPTLPDDILDPANDQKGLVIDFATKKIILGDPGAASATAAQVSAAQSAAAQASADAAAAAASASAAAAAVSAATIAPVVTAIDTTAGNVAHALPSAAANPDTFYYIINKSFSSGFNVQVGRTGADLIHGGTSDTIGPGETGKYWSDGVSNWYALH
jgi:hypothetical protein